MDPTSPSQVLEARTSFEQQGGGNQPFTVTDAISYVTSVKLQFAEQLEVYDEFLDILKDFKNQRIDEQAVTERLSVLFYGYPDLIRGFNIFCPAGHHIDPNAPGVTATVAHGTTNLA
ncbi:hypothetical protein V8D89_002312 [Ganoderma adspersum]